MKLLKEIKDKEFPEDESGLKLREASRIVLFDENDMIPLLFVSKENYHKLPGGGIDEGEEKEDALVRECLEEVGSEIEVLGEVGQIVEFRAKWNLKQISYCYYGKIISKGEPNFTEKELSQGFQVDWFSLKDAISKLESETSEDYNCYFMRNRDLEILKKVQEIIKNN